MKLPLLISALILIAFGLLCFAPEASVSFQPPAPEPQWVPSQVDVVWWQIQRWSELQPYSNCAVNRCPDYI